MAWGKCFSPPLVRTLVVYLFAFREWGVMNASSYDSGELSDITFAAKAMASVKSSHLASVDLDKASHGSWHATTRWLSLSSPFRLLNRFHGQLWATLESGCAELERFVEPEYVDFGCETATLCSVLSVAGVLLHGGKGNAKDAEGYRCIRTEQFR